ncbi:MAG: M12 family metallo-peptidase [Fimbriimonadaceae bacterium]
MLAFLLTTTLQSPKFVDSDLDGLYDRWETEGFGPIRPSVHGCNPKRADVFIIFRMRAGMTQAKIQPTIDRVKEFYADLPFTNPDGSKGLNMIPIVPEPMSKEHNAKDYKQLYKEGMPEEWRGLAHGILVDDSPGGGGQCNRPDWCGTGYNWMTMVHEVGHQFGLPHDPMGARTGSPFHPSLMNYDYSYQLGGKGEAIQYSPGKFSSMRMKENDLNETVPFSLEDLQFLASRPYYFKLQKLDEKRTAIDWNRNGIFGEKHIRADVNDGYSASYRGQVKLEFAAGATALAALGPTLFAIYPDLPKRDDYKEYAFRALTRDKSGKLQVQAIQNGKAMPQQTLVDSGVAGDPTAISVGDTIWVSYPTTKGYAIQAFRQTGSQLSETKFLSEADPDAQPTLVAMPNSVALLIWNEKSMRVSLKSISEASSPAQVIDGLESQYPVGAVWNATKQCLAIVTALKQGEKSGRLKINHLRNMGGKWKIFESFWVEGEKGSAATSWRPQVLLSPDAGYMIFLKGSYADPHQGGLNYLCRQIADKTMSDGWRTKMLGNEWANTRSVCGVTNYQGDIAYAVRWHAGVGGAEDARLSVSLRASGIENEWLTDFDEVGYIFKTGLASSLQSVRDEQWKPKKP